MIFVEALDDIFIGKEFALEGFFGSVALFGLFHEQFFEEDKDLRVELTTLWSIKQVPNDFFVKVILTLNMERKSSDD